MDNKRHFILWIVLIVLILHLNIAPFYSGVRSIQALDEDDSYIYLPVIIADLNYPPNIPSDPSPINGASSQGVDVDLQWLGGDPAGDLVTYDIYFEAGDSTPDYLICNDLNSLSCDPGTLGFGIQYFWQVIARDQYGLTASGPVWSFTTTNVFYDWTLISPSVGVGLKSIFFVDQYTGWVTGDDGAIYHTTDGGLTWLPQSSGTTSDLKDMFFTTKNNGWIIGGKNLILRTTDGGTTWVSQTSPVDTYLESIKFANDTYGFIAGCHYTLSGTYPVYTFTAHGYVLRSADGGDSWSLASRDGITYRCIKDLHFVSGSLGWLAAEYTGSYSNGYPTYPRVFTTSDGGDTWVLQSLPITTGSINAIAFSDSNTGWIVGGSGRILNTVNGGSLWTTQVGETLGNYSYVQFANLTEGWLGSPINHTTNSGLIWDSQVVDPACGNVIDISVINADHVFALGSTGVICKHNQVP
ncbi:MAG: hypothetical protein JW987_05005 [Anaerolineaceae bacterium]|nr:hypothetical protein [Anaerolineaceae bacterium]